jgi:hypothetical protein
MAPVTERLSRLRGAIRRLFALDGLSRLVLAMAAFVVVTFLLDWSLLLPSGVRLVLLAAGLAGFGVLAFKRIFYPLGVKISDDDLALFVERHFPELNDRLISAIQLSREPLGATPEGGAANTNSPELVAALVADAEQATSRIDFRRVVIGKHVGKIALWAAAAVLALAGAGAARSDYAGIYFNRVFGGSTKWPQRTHLKVLDFADNRKVWPRGEDLTIAVQVLDHEPSKVMLEYKFATGEKGRERMSPLAGKRYQFTFTRLTGPFEFFVEGGDDVTAVHTVDIVTPPSIDTVKLFYEYPPYMRMANTPADRPETSGNVIAPIGTKRPPYRHAARPFYLNILLKKAISSSVVGGGSKGGDLFICDGRFSQAGTVRRRDVGRLLGLSGSQARSHGARLFLRPKRRPPYAVRLCSQVGRLGILGVRNRR